MLYEISESWLCPWDFPVTSQVYHDVLVTYLKKNRHVFFKYEGTC